MVLFLMHSTGHACGHIPRNLAAWASHYAHINGIEPEFLIAHFWVESRFCTGSVSPKGAMGIAQLTPAAAREVGVDRTDVLQNMLGGARYLRKQLHRFKRWDLALAAYNAGPQAVVNAGYRVPDFEETQNHIRKVKAVYLFLKGQKKHAQTR